MAETAAATSSDPGNLGTLFYSVELQFKNLDAQLSGLQQKLNARPLLIDVQISPQSLERMRQQIQAVGQGGVGGRTGGAGGRVVNSPASRSAIPAGAIAGAERAGVIPVGELEDLFGISLPASTPPIVKSLPASGVPSNTAGRIIGSGAQSPASAGSYGVSPRGGGRARSSGMGGHMAYYNVIFGGWEAATAYSAIQQGETNAAYASNEVEGMRARAMAARQATSGIFSGMIGAGMDLLGLASSPLALDRGATAAEFNRASRLNTQLLSREGTAEQSRAGIVSRGGAFMALDLKQASLEAKRRETSETMQQQIEDMNKQVNATKKVKEYKLISPGASGSLSTWGGGYSYSGAAGSGGRSATYGWVESEVPALDAESLFNKKRELSGLRGKLSATEAGFAADSAAIGRERAIEQTSFASSTRASMLRARGMTREADQEEFLGALAKETSGFSGSDWMTFGFAYAGSKMAEFGAKQQWARTKEIGSLVLATDVAGKRLAGRPLEATLMELRGAEQLAEIGITDKDKISAMRRKVEVDVNTVTRDFNNATLLEGMALDSGITRARLISDHKPGQARAVQIADETLRELKGLELTDKNKYLTIGPKIRDLGIASMEAMIAQVENSGRGVSVNPMKTGWGASTGNGEDMGAVVAKLDELINVVRNGEGVVAK